MEPLAAAIIPERSTWVRRIALVGNPNTGKSTLFNALTGFRQRVGNYPGVTVERKIGALRHAGKGHRVEILDLPGTYSLAARSLDERIVTDVVSGMMEGERRPDLIVSVVDASNLARNLFLTTQVMELGVPVVVALNMSDVAERNGVHINADKLADLLGSAVVPTNASQMRGISALSHTIIEALGSAPPRKSPPLPESVRVEVRELRERLVRVGGNRSDVGPSDPMLLQVLLEPGGYAESQFLERVPAAFHLELEECRSRLGRAGIELANVEAVARYSWIEDVVRQVETRVRSRVVPLTDRIDQYLTHRVFGLLAFVIMMAVAFQAVYAWAAPLMAWIESGVAALGSSVGAVLPEGALQSLVVDGAIAGVGGVLVFLPQILILFLFIGLLEDCGYMARAAMLLHRFMSCFGLNGKAFIPLLSSFACAVPGIMSTRTMERSSDRLVTILVAPLMSCSARLPVYALMIGAFVPNRPVLGRWLTLQGLTLLAMYLVGVIVAIPVALLLRGGLVREKRQAFLIELPPYQWPQWQTVLYRVYERGREFVVQAGTLIIAVSVMVWAAAYFPRPARVLEDYSARRQLAQTTVPAERLDEALAVLDRQEAGELLRESYLGRIGRWIEPAVKPLGWDWRIGMAAVASFPAREVIIATLGTIFNLGSNVDEGSEDLRSALSAATWPDGRPLFNLPVALSIMVFFALCCQCAATLATIKRETNSWRWPMFTFAYMTVLAYAGAWAVFHLAGVWA